VRKLCDIAGKLVNTLASWDRKPGYYNLVWNRQDTRGRSAACGVYFCTLSAGDQREGLYAQGHISGKIVPTE